MKRSRWCCAVIAFLSAVGCTGVKGTIIDTSGYESTASRMRLEKGNSLRFQYDGTTREVRLRKLRELEVIADRPQVLNRELYLPVRVTVVHDGIIKSTQKSNRYDRGVYLYVNDALTGKTNDGTLRVGLERVQKLTIEHRKAGRK